MQQTFEEEEEEEESWGAFMIRTSYGLEQHVLYTRYQSQA
jgi:hypothetical protein